MHYKLKKIVKTITAFCVYLKKDLKINQPEVFNSQDQQLYYATFFSPNIAIFNYCFNATILARKKHQEDKSYNFCETQIHNSLLVELIISIGQLVYTDFFMCKNMRIMRVYLKHLICKE